MNTMETLMADAAHVIDFRPVISGGCRRIVRVETPRLCRACGERRSRFYAQGTVKADRTHTLCFECYRGTVNRTRALRVRGAADIRMVASAVPGPARLRGDREAFYADLRRRRNQALIAARHAVEGLTGRASDAAPVVLPDALLRVS